MFRFSVNRLLFLFRCRFPISVEEAICPATIAKFCATGETLTTDGHRLRAARVEATSARGTNEAGNLTTHGQFCHALAVTRLDAVWVGRGSDQQLRVGMHGTLDHLLTWTTFHHLTSIHYQGILG